HGNSRGPPTRPRRPWPRPPRRAKCAVHRRQRAVLHHVAGGCKRRRNLLKRLGPTRSRPAPIRHVSRNWLGPARTFFAAKEPLMPRLTTALLMIGLLPAIGWPVGPPRTDTHVSPDDKPDPRRAGPALCPNENDLARLQSCEGKRKWEVIQTLGHAKAVRW